MRQPFLLLRSYIAGSPARDIFHGMRTLVLGSGGGRFIGLASVPLLTRLYSPSDFGVLSIFTSMVLILAPLLTLRYAVAIPLPRTDTAAMNVFALSALTLLATAFAITVSLGIAAEFLLGLFKMEALTSWWWLIILGIIGTAGYELFSLWATRQRDYAVIARTQITQSAVGEGLKILLGLLSVKPLGLLAGQVVAQSSGIGTFLAKFQKDFRRHIRHVSRQRMIFMARYYRAFPFYRLPSQFLLILAVQAPLLLSAALYGPATTGQLSLALAALAVPVQLIGQSLGTAYYAEISRLGKSNSEKILIITKSLQKFLFIISIIPALILIFFSETVFKIAFGEEWSNAGIYASILTPYIILQFTSAPLIQVLNVFNGQRLFLIINILRITLLGAMYLFIVDYDVNAERFVASYSFIMSVFYLIVSVSVIMIISRHARIRSKP